MKALAGVTVLSFAVSIMAQQVTPPAVPNVAPARPQPGIASGASGGVGVSATGRVIPGNASGVTVPGRPIATPPPVLMTPDQLWPMYLEPLVLVPELFPLDPYRDLPPEPVVGQGRPGGLGVTITGGATNPPPVTPPPATNSTTAVTNTPPPLTNGNIPNPAPPQLPQY
jgi:hypothetical protein